MERTTFTFSTTSEKLDKIRILIKKKSYPDLSTCINTAIDKLLEVHQMSLFMDFMYWICFPLFLFLISVGVCLFYPNIFFFIISAMTGFYLMIFIILFYKKYKGVKWQKEF